MSKKHFIALADMIKRHNQDAAACFAEPARMQFNYEQIQALADWCASQNSRFNRGRWLAYISGQCGPNGGKV